MRIKDLFSKDITAKLRSLFHLKHKDEFTTGKKVKGEIFYTIRENGKIVESSRLEHLGASFYKPHLVNIVTLNASVLLARLMKDSSEPTAGVAYFALGTGNIGWNILNPPAPTGSESTLETEISRVIPTQAQFIDTGTFLPTLTPTNIVDFDFDFAEADAVGGLVECGLVGGDATGTPSVNDTLITYRTFPIISKTNTMTISFTYRLTF